jgi:septal ring factor EnvC (AmiA/AmiB activator)
LSEDETSTSALEKKIKVLSEQNASQTDELTLMRIENENLKKKIADMEVSLKASVDFQTFARGTLNQLVSEKRKLTNELAAFKGKHIRE